MGRTSRRDSVRLLDVALHAGITHFDVARSYGYGEAEGAVGDFLRHRRDGVTVTTKLGIQPPPRTHSRTFAKAAVRRLGPLGAPARALARRRGESLQSAGRFSVDEARASLETSLRELRTDHVDLLLLHEADPSDLSDDLLEFLTARVADGAIGQFGIACRPDQTAAVLEHRPEFAPVVQVANSIGAPTLATLPDLSGRLVYTHSALAGLGRMSRAADPSEREPDPASLMLAWALRENPGGRVIFSSRDPDRIRANAGAGDLDDHEISRFAGTVHDPGGVA